MSGLGLTLAAVLGASLLGSLHCVAMCGGFAASVSVDSQRGPLLAYQAARGLAYASLGALAGLLGAGLDASAAIVGIQRAAGPLMGLILIALAVSTLRGARPDSTALVRLGAGRRPGFMQRLRLGLIMAVREHGVTAGAAAGLLTALLPCGWLWAYLAVAAATGSVTGGLLVMIVFWLGSVPALLGVGLLAGELGRRLARSKLGRHAPRISAALLLALGVLSLAGKLSLAPSPAASEIPEPEHASTAPTEVPQQAPCH